MKSPWIPETRTVGNKTYVRLCKWDRGFVRYVTARGLNFADKSTFANAEFFDELCSLRNQKCDSEFRKAVQDDEQGADGVDKNHNTNNKRQRKTYIRKARASDDVILPASFEIMLPALPGYEGEHKCMMLIDGIRTSTLYVELNSFNLEYIRAGMQQSKLGRSRGRASRSEHAAGDPSKVSELSENE